MTRKLSEYLTNTSAAYLRDAIGAVNRDSFDRHQQEASIGLEALQIAFDWQANDNESRMAIFLRNEKKRTAHLEEQNSKFREGINAIAEQVFDKKSWPEPAEWTKHFPEYSIAHGVVPLSFPDEKKLRAGSFEHCFAWSDFNIQRIAQHEFTLAICSELVRDSHQFKHLEVPLTRAKAFVWRQQSRLDGNRMQLILLEGDPTKIQAVREEILDSVRLENRSTSHFYGHFNTQSMGSSDCDKRFRDEALRQVQAGFSLSTEVAATKQTSYSDLGLG